MNEFEIEGRLRKARALVEQAQMEGLDKMDLEMMIEREWLLLAEAAGVKPPSKKTKGVAIALMPVGAVPA